MFFVTDLSAFAPIECAQLEVYDLLVGTTQDSRQASGSCMPWPVQIESTVAKESLYMHVQPSCSYILTLGVAGVG